VFGWRDEGWVRDDQHVWDGQGLKDPCFFATFSIIIEP